MSMLLVFGVWLGSLASCCSTCQTLTCELTTCLTSPAYIIGFIIVVLIASFSIVCTAAVLVVAIAMKLGCMALAPFSPRLVAGAVVGLIAMAGLSDQFADFTMHAFSGPGRSYFWSSTLFFWCSLCSLLSSICSQMLWAT